MKRILIAVFFAIALTGVVHAQTGIQLNWNAPGGSSAGFAVTGEGGESCCSGRNGFMGWQRR